MLNKDEIFEIIKSVDKNKLALEMIEETLSFSGIDGVVFAEIDVKTGDINVKFRANWQLKPEVEKGLWIAQFTTENMDDIPDDLEDEIKNAEDSVAEFYRRYPAYYVEFFEDYDIEERMEKLGVASKVKLLLTTVELNKADEREDVIEVLDKDTLRNIIDNLDINKIAHEAFDDARSHSSISGSVNVEIDARDGEVSIGFYQSNTMTIGYYDTYINLFSIKTGYGSEDYGYPDQDVYLFTESEHIAYFNELKERNYRIEEEEEEGEILDDSEIRDAVIEKFDLDLDDLLEEYYQVIDTEMLECLYDTRHVDNQIDEFYSNTVEGKNI